MSLIAWDPKKKRMVNCGTIAGDTLFRDVKPNHFMRVVQGYGIQNYAFQAAVQKGVKKIVLKETHTGARWEAPVKIWLLNGKVADYGHGKQRFLSLKFMKTHKIKEEEII